MPKFLEDKLKAQYGKRSSIPYKIMNAQGYMRGNKETPKGRKAEEKHDLGLGGGQRKKIKKKAKTFAQALNG